MEFFRLMASASAPSTVTEGGGGPERAHVICGFLGCDIRSFNPVVEALPRVLYLRRQPGTRADSRLSQLVELALAESQEQFRSAESARQAAQRSAAESQAVVEFLTTDVLGAARPT